MSPLVLARWQFAVTSVFHFFFVPLTIGLAFLIAIMQTLAYRGHDPAWERMTAFWTRLFLINFAVGVVTGIVQEFQFGMNWSQYSVFVGNVFGAPLAVEGLLAFFMESTFLGIWIFGRGRIPPLLHLLSIWMVAVATVLSAAFILAANAWMQHPVGYTIDHATHQAVMTNFLALLTQSTFLGEFAHVVLAAFLMGAMFVLGTSAYHLLRHHEEELFRRAAQLAVVVAAVCALGVGISGDNQARLMDSQQPMKMAAAEALYNTTDGASFSLLTIGNLSGQPIFQIRVPHLLSLLSTLSWNGKVQGMNQVEAEETARYGPGQYRPIIWVTYWSFRIMAGAGVLMLLMGLAGLWLWRRGRLGSSRWYLRAALGAVALPYLASTAGWIFTEMGRQPWVVYGLMKTAAAVSPDVPLAMVALTLVGYTAVYTTLGLLELGLMLRFARQLPESRPPEPTTPALVY